MSPGAALAADGAALALAAGVLTLVLVAGLRMARAPSQPAAASLDALHRRLVSAEEKLETMARDLGALGAVVHTLPTRESIHQIGLSLAESRGKIEGLQDTLRGQTRQLDLIVEFLMKSAAEAVVAGRPDPGARP
ncbi:hypothetical protein [Methylobacterium sp. J-070]|uniref:hypothetical protein n=1 Tax=Methylobacterium sp. J-070 TaxID=2836650 RepID=UPI001FBB3C74|nr:hypothetical protein [Methylobacterium sp. J-070]MCJ2050887.1 hypothetical protein [Methylobacterium sp. J-070]